MSVKVRQVLSAEILEPLFWWRKGMPVIDRYREFQELQWDTVEEYRNRQKKALKNLLLHAVTTIPFYKKHRFIANHDAITVNPWTALNEFPILTKQGIQQNINELYTELDRGTNKNSSGGSTGEPVIVYQDKIYKTKAIASTKLFYEWAGRTPGMRMVKLWGAERDLVKGGYGLKQKLSDLISSQILVNAYIMSPERLRMYVKKINKPGVRYVEGYADSLYELARFSKNEVLPLNQIDSVISSAGTLYPHMREQIEKTFQAPVFDRYGSREAGNMAAECEKHQGLHIFGETTLIEVVDDQGRQVEEGEEGEILVTNLANHTMPLIRYRIGDRAVRGSERCSCGRPYPMLQRITGRSGACFRTTGGGVVSTVFFAQLIGVIQNDGQVGKFQVIQEAFDHVVVRLVPVDRSTFKSWKSEKEVVRLIKKVMGEECKVDTRIESEIEPTATGKHLYTVSRLNEF